MGGVDCTEAVESLLELLEGTLDPRVRREIEEHLRLCPPCERIRSSYVKSCSLCGRVLRRDPPVGMADRLLVVLREKTASGYGK